jgi:hypothetical protein
MFPGAIEECYAQEYSSVRGSTIVHVEHGQIVDWRFDPDEAIRLRNSELEEGLMSGKNTSGGSQSRLDEDSALFDFRFSRSYRLMHFIACRILDDPEQATKAVENCRHSASVRAPRFEYEGAFRSWLARVLIDEALLLLGRKQQTLETNISLEVAGPRRNRINVAESNA